MNRWVPLGLGTVALVAAVALYFAGHVVPAAIALVLSVVCDVLFAFALRGAQPQRESR